MRTALVIAGLLVALVAWPQEIYRWVDKDGVVHYADQPGAPDAQRMPQRGRGATGPATSRPELYAPTPQTETQPAGPPYRSLRIATPKADEVFFGTDAVVTVQLELDQDLRLGDKAIVIVDGTRVPEFEGLSTTVTGLSRGSHFLSAVIVDEAGNAVIASPQLTFYLRQNSVISPPTGPTVTPRPSGAQQTPPANRSN